MQIVKNRRPLPRHGLRRGSFHLDVAESVVGKARRPGFPSRTPQRIRKERRTTGRTLADQARCIEQLARRQPHWRAGRAADRDGRPTREVLAQVVDEDARSGLCHASGREPLLDANRRARLRAQDASRSLHQGRSPPLGIVKTRPVPALRFEARIEVLASVNARERQRAVADPP